MRLPGIPLLLRRLWIGVVLLIPISAVAQPDNRAFEERYHLPDSLRYGVQAHAFSFFRNLEYFTPAADGKTLLGQQLSVRGLLHPTEQLTLSGGVYLWKDFGKPGLHQIAPLFTLRYQTGRFALVFGNLEGQLSHRQIEPLQDFESVITRRQEEGFQFTYNGPKLWGDLWLDWQNMIYRYSPEQEQLQVGLHLRPTLAEGEGGRLVGILQARAFHRGGQLDTNPAKPTLSTFWALAPGLRVDQLKAGRHSFLLDGYYVLTKGITQTFPEGVRKGNGFYANAQWTSPWFGIMASYWHGDGVYVPGGGPLYSSLAQEVAAEARGQVLPKRDLLILRFMRDFPLAPGCTLTLRTEPHYDFSLSRLDYNYQMFINYQPGWAWGKR